MSRWPFHHAINGSVRPRESATSRSMSGAYAGTSVIFARRNRQQAVMLYGRVTGSGSLVLELGPLR
jgi:hypothetical protein